MPLPRIKICGITNAEDAEYAAALGADALGFILYPKSARFIEPSGAWPFISQLPPFIQRVAVTVDADLAHVEAIEAEAEFDVWQLHGNETPETCASLWSRRVVKAIHLSPETLQLDYSAYPVDAFLLDTPSPAFGGTGQTFDWRLAMEFKQRVKKPVILSGGLSPDNIAQAVELVQPYAVDVCSGVESAPGKKDHAKLRDFIQICKKL